MVSITNAINGSHNSLILITGIVTRGIFGDPRFVRARGEEPTGKSLGVAYAAEAASANGGQLVQL